MTEGISYHNKDVLFKFLSELYKDATLDAFGIQGLPKISQLLPTAMPKVRADEKTLGYAVSVGRWLCSYAGI